MSKIICFANNKGGVGKSSLSLHLAGALLELGNKILLVDLDAQANLSSVFVDDPNSLSLTIADLIYDDVHISSAILETKFKQLTLLAACSRLEDLDARLAGDDDSQFFLSEELEQIDANYDFILIDCPPNLGKATRMAFVAADYVVVPIQCQDWSVKACRRMVTVIERVQKRVNSRLKLLGIVVNRFNRRRRLENTYVHRIRESFGKEVFQTVFADNVPYVEAITMRLPMTAYKPKSPQADICRSFAMEVIKRVEG